MFWKKKAQSPEAQAVTDSIKALKTLRLHKGALGEITGISISPSEVLTPQYLEDRRNAACLISGSSK